MTEEIRNPITREFLSSLTDAGKIELFKQRAQQVAAQKGLVMYDPDPVRWITNNFFVPELKNGPLQLDPYQIGAMKEATARDGSGRFKYSTIVWSDIKKSIKSTIAAAMCLWRAWGLQWGSIITVANDLKQADSRVGYYLRRSIELNQKIKPLVRFRNYRVELPNRTIIESVAIDPTGEAGSNADFIVFSELWGAHQEAQQRMWVEMTLPPNKYGYSQRWVETYAGYSGESPLLEQLYDQGVKQGRRINVSYTGDDGVFHDLSHIETYVNDPARLFVLWNTEPRLPWQTADYYAQEAAVIPPHEFLRIHRNQWVTSSQKFVPDEWWEACEGSFSDPLPDEPVVFALDAGVSSDCFGLVGVYRRGNKVYVFYSRAWYPPQGGKIDFKGPEMEIRALADKYNVVEWAYDQFQLHDMATRLRDDGLGWFNVFSQASDRLVADKLLYDKIRERSIVHRDDPVLNAHISNSNAQTDNEKMRIVKRAELLKIDLAVSTSMATAEAMRLNIGVYEE